MSELSQETVIRFVKKGLELMGCDNMNIPIIFKNDLRDSNIGEVRQYDNGFLEIHFNMALLPRGLGNWTWQECVSHELVHVKQCVTKQLTRVGGRMFWNGKDATDWCKVAMVYLRLGQPKYYKDLPWEAEAFENQYKLSLIIQGALDA